MAEQSPPNLNVAGSTVESQTNIAVEEALLGGTSIAVNATPERFEFFLTKAGDMIIRLDSLHRFMLDLGNYFFAFQGVCLAAISNVSYLNCSNAWFLTLLSILSAIPSLAALAFLAHEWIHLMRKFEDVLTMMEEIHTNLGEQYAVSLDVTKNFYSIIAGKKYSYLVRYFLLVMGAVIILAFTVAVAAGPPTIICAHNGHGI